MKKKAVTVATAAFLSAGFSTPALADAYHQVQSGDTLSQIAKKYHTSVSRLKGLNGLSSDLIYVNQKLKVSGTDSPGTGSGAVAAPSKSSSGSVAPSGAVKSSAKSYRIVSGDTLLKIANKHGISLAELKQWNKIESHMIYPGQLLFVSRPTSGAPAPAVNSGANPTVSTPPKPAVVRPSAGSGSVKPSLSDNANESKYVIKSGDTLGKISLQYGVSVAELKSRNNLLSDLIYAGQTLVVSAAGGGSKWTSGSSGSGAVSGQTGTSGSGVSGVKQTTAKGSSISVQVSASTVIAEAKKLIGIPYVYGGQTTAGFDCSGFIYYVLKQAGSTMNRQSSAGYYDRAYYVDTPQVGDLVFFSNTYREGISHMGIYLGGNQFIHAGSSGVMISSVGSGYWKDHFDSFKRFY